MSEQRPTGFRVPFGLEAPGCLVPPCEARKGRVYTCPVCSSTLIHRAGTHKRHHFAHRTDVSACNPETILHQTAKLLIAQTVRSALACQTRIDIEVKCEECRRPFRLEVPVERINTVEVEVRMASGRIADVLLMQDSEPRLAVEILVSHEVDSRKAGDIECPWIELRAEEVLTNPTLWMRRAGRLRVKCCRTCRALSTELERRKAQVLTEAHVELPSGYNVELARCRGCDRTTMIFRWAAERWSRQRPPDPIPRSVKWRRSKEVATGYWANTCIWCGTLLGDWYTQNDIADFRYDVWQAINRQLEVDAARDPAVR